MSRLLALIVGVLLVGGCSAAATGAPSSAGASTTSSMPAPAAEPYPWSVAIPAIDAHSTLVPLGLTPAGELEVPSVDQPMQAGWYAGADPRTGDDNDDGIPDGDGDEYQPGEVGPAVIAGHVDGVIDGRKGQPGIFHRLPEVKPGDEVLVDRVDGSRLRFVVERVEKHSKASFPTEQVYGPTDRPELRLITCGGAFDRAAGHYEDNWIVWAVLA